MIFIIAFFLCYLVMAAQFQDQEPHQRCLSQVEAAGTVARQESLELLVSLGLGCRRPVLDSQWNGLDWTCPLGWSSDTVPGKGRAEDGMALDNQREGATELLRVQRLTQHYMHLLNVVATGQLGGIVQQRLVEHARLHGRQREGRFGRCPLQHTRQRRRQWLRYPR